MTPHRTATTPSSIQSGMRGATPLFRVLLRRYRFQLLCWVVPIVVLVAATVPSYASTYPSLASRAPLVARLRGGGATKIMYGTLPLPGTLGQLAQWEVGTYVVLLTAVMSLIVTVSMTRSDEDQGRTEVVAAAGLGRWAPLTAVALMTVVVNAVLGTSIAAVLAAQSVGSAELDIFGAVTFGAVVAVTGIGVAATTLVIAELLWDTSSARFGAWMVLALMWGVRVCADMVPAGWMRWFTWFGVKDLVSPYTFDRVLPLLIALTVSAGLFGAALVIHARREFGAGLLSPPHRHARQLLITSPLGLAWRLHRGSLCGWSLPTVAVAALFGGMSSTLIGLAANDTSTASMFAQMSPANDPVRQYFGFTSVFVTLLAMCFGVRMITGVAAAERNGLVDTEIATGVGRVRPLLSRAALAAAGATVLLLTGASVQAAITAALTATGRSAYWAFADPAGQIFGVLAAIGLTVALVGVIPRRAAFAWAAVGWSAFAELFGDLVHLPSWARNASLLGHGPTSLAGWIFGSMHWGAVAALVGFAVVTTAVGAVSMRRRDVGVG